VIVRTSDAVIITSIKFEVWSDAYAVNIMQNEKFSVAFSSPVSAKTKVNYSVIKRYIALEQHIWSSVERNLQPPRAWRVYFLQHFSICH